MHTLNQQVRQKRVPSTRKSVPQTPAGVKNAYAPPKSASKTRTFRQKSAPVGPLDGNEPPSGTPLPGRVKRWFCSITRVFSCILRHAGSDPVAERGRGEVNLSPILGLTLRPRVGGFCDMSDWTPKRRGSADRRNQRGCGISFASKTRTLTQKVRPTTRTLRQKVGLEASKTRTLRQKVRQNTYP